MLPGAAGLFSSRTDDWATPVELFAQLDRRYGPFDLDVCATAANTKCKRFYSPEVDGCWCNPPYGRTIGKWARKAWESSLNGALVVCLVPARTDTAWWQDIIQPHATEIRFLRGRVHFGGGRNGAPFPSAVVVFRPAVRFACQWCERQFRPRRRDSKFCSGACKQAAGSSSRTSVYWPRAVAVVRGTGMCGLHGAAGWDAGAGGACRQRPCGSAPATNYRCFATGTSSNRTSIFPS